MQRQQCAGELISVRNGYSPACHWMSARCFGEMNRPADTIAFRGPRMVGIRPAFLAIKRRPSEPTMLKPQCPGATPSSQIIEDRGGIWNGFHQRNYRRFAWPQTPSCDKIRS